LRRGEEMHFLKTAKIFAGEASVLDAGLLKIAICALGILIGVAAPKTKKLKTTALAGGMLAATALPLMNKFFDISDELSIEKRR